MVVALQLLIVHPFLVIHRSVDRFLGRLNQIWSRRVHIVQFIDGERNVPESHILYV